MMDIESIVQALIASLASGGGIAGFMNWRQKKKAAELANDASAATQWRELYERAEAKVEAQGTKIEGLFKTLQEVRERLNNADTELAVSRLLECRKTPCVDRDPPFGSHVIKHKKNNGPIQ